ncbi:MAG: response regulator [Pseudomonadota bacterium]|nr:response regulator [Pseudomonadota bacterium]
MSNDALHYFRIEAQELVAELRQGLMDLDRAPWDRAVVRRLFRVAHTLKGAAQVVDHARIAGLAHAVEEFLSPFRDGTDLVPPELLRDAFHLVQGMDDAVLALDRPAAGGDPSSANRPPSAPYETMRVELKELDALLASLSELEVQIAGFQRPEDGLNEARRIVNALGIHLSTGSSAGAAYLPAEADRSLVSLVDDLARSLDRCHVSLRSARDRAETEVSLLHDRAQRMRLIPTSVLLSTLERAARDAGQMLGKPVIVTSSGGHLHLDSHILETLKDALLQLVRNAVVHGIESAAGRAAAGKSTSGQVRLSVERRGGKVALICADDGAGIDIDGIGVAAVRRGALTPAEGADLTLPHAVDLLRAGGISTRGSADMLSGRGVGFNVVNTAVERLNGELTVRSDRGLGTTVEIVVPVSLTAIRSLKVEAGGLSAWIPIDAIARAVRVPAGEVVGAAHNRVVTDAGETLPFLTLHDVLEAPVRARPGSTETMLLLQAGGRRVALGVDRIVGVRDILARPIVSELTASRLVAATTLDSAGVPELVLEPLRIVEMAPELAPLVEATNERLPILIVDDCATSRLVEQEILQAAGYEVDLADTGEEGLRRAKRRAYGAFIVDVEMPGMDGFEFVTRIHAHPLLAQTPCFLVTSRSAAAYRRRGELAGVTGYVLKGDLRRGDFLEQLRRHTG